MRDGENDRRQTDRQTEIEREEREGGERGGPTKQADTGTGKEDHRQ